MARCPKCLILEGSEGALACEITGCPRTFGELTPTALKAATVAESRTTPSIVAGNPVNDVPDSAQLSRYQRAGHTPPKPGSRPRGRPRNPIASMTVYDRDLGVGEIPANLSGPKDTPLA